MKPATEAWIEVAEMDFRMVEHELLAPDPVYEGIGFHAQQCIEKYLKATLEQAGHWIPRIHDLGQLVELTVDILPDLLPLQTPLELTMPFVVTYRYPHEPVELTELEEDTERAVDAMRKVRSIVRHSLGLRDD